MSIPETAARDSLADATVETVRRWLRESENVPSDASAQRLAGVLKDPVGLDFTIGFVDRVVRPEDLRVAGHNLQTLSRTIPRFLPWYMRLAIVIGGALAPALPRVVVPIARAVLRSMVGHLIVDATAEKLDKHLVALRTPGTRLNLNLLGEAVLGDAEADRRLAGTKQLLERDDVDYVSIKVSAVVSQLSMWEYDEAVERIVERLAPLYEYAAASPTAKFINLDMEEYKDLDLTIEVFTRLLQRPALTNLEAGIVLQAYLPDALGAFQRLTTWSAARRRAGGAGIKVRLVKGANLAMERVDATIHDWPLATVGSKQAADANYKRVLRYAFTPEHTDAVRVGVAGHNLFDVAYAWLLAKERGVESRVEFEMLLGMATAQADAVRRDVGGLLLYTPVVQPSEFDSAISYLIRRLEENASSDNFMSGVFDLGSDEGVFARERDRFLASLAELDASEQTGEVPHPNRQQNRDDAASIGHLTGREFANEPDTDPSTPANRLWGRRVLDRAKDSETGAAAVHAARVDSGEEIERLVAETRTAAGRWLSLPVAERAAILHAAGETLGAYRGRLIEVMASETGKIIAEADVEVSEAIDFAHFYAGRSLELADVEGARFEPSRLVLVVPPWNFPVSIPAGGVLAGLASGAAVIIKPAPQSKRSAAVMVEALWEAGVPRDVLRFVDVEEGPIGQRLVSHPGVDRVILTGSYETAELFRSWRTDLPLLAETSGKNSIIVTPSADLDLAVSDTVKSAFGNAGQKCSAASLVILVGSAARSERFRRQLVDAVRTMHVGPAWEPETHMGPIIEPAAGKLLAGLTRLGPGESWLVKPELVRGDTYWSPGVRDGVRPGSEFHLTEYFGPVLGIMTAATLDEAIALQNAPAYGLTAGVHSLDPAEIERWLDTVQAGNLYVNRGITGAIVRRQPFGGWKRSAVGTGTKAGGVNYLFGLGSWKPVPAAQGEDLRIDGVSDGVRRLIESAQPGLDFEEFDGVRRGAESDERAWRDEYGQSRDVSALTIERNVFRYRPVGVTVRLADGRPVGDLVRVMAAATRAGAPIAISSSVPLPTPLVDLLLSPLAPLTVTDLRIETDPAFTARARSGALGAGRIRLVGPALAHALASALGGAPDVAVFAGEVTASGRVELLPFLREQAIAITAHRFGNPDPVLDAVRV